MVMLERHDQVNAELDQLLAAAGDLVDQAMTRDRRTPRGRGAADGRARGGPGGVRAPGRPSTRRPTRSARRRRRSRPRSAPAGGLLATLEGRPVGALLLAPDGGTVGCAASASCRPPSGSGWPAPWWPRRWRPPTAPRWRCVAREELPATVEFWRGHGFVETGRPVAVPSSCGVPSRAPTPPPTPTRCATSARLVGRLVRAGDLVVLSGELGAGKTTFTQGLGAGLGVRGGVTSPTFVIARVHPSLAGGPGPRPRRRLPPGRHRRARRPRPGRLARRGGHGRRVGQRASPRGSRTRASRYGSPAPPQPRTPTTPTPSTLARSPSSPSAPAGSASPGRNRDSPLRKSPSEPGSG